MVINYSQPDDWEKMNALGVSQYGQMTAGSYMYIGPQGIVHGTTITVLNGFRKIKISRRSFCHLRTRRNEWRNPKVGNIAGCITVCAEVNPKITHIRHGQVGLMK
jgi:urocanate hydratase